MDPIQQLFLSLIVITAVVLGVTFGFLHLSERSRFLRRWFRRRKRAFREDDSYRPVDPGLAYRLGQAPKKTDSE